MSHRASYYGRIYEENGKIYRVLRAEWGTDPETQEVKYSCDVFRECLEDGKCEARNIHYTGLGGWLVDFPGEKITRNIGYGYKEKKVIELEDWWETQNYTGFGYSQNEMWIETVKYVILEVHPELKYLFKKILIDDGSQKPGHKYQQFQYSKLFNIIRTYWAHPESETLFQLGCFQLAMNENLYKLSKPKLKQILSVVTEMKNKGELFDIQLKDIQCYYKCYETYKLSFTDWWNYWCWDDMNRSYISHIGYDIYKYCMKKNISKYEYIDYINMAEKVGHNVKDEYWKYPNDFRKFHDKVMEQNKALEVAKYGVQQDFLKEILKPMLKYNTNIDGYDIFLSTSALEWQKTCDTLYQCLLRNGYMKNVIMQEDIIVFIWKNGTPIATAQLDYNKKVGQFYGDERGHSRGESCKPSEEVEVVFNKWLETFKPKKAKFFVDSNIHYYKGFNDIVEGGFHTDVGRMDGGGKGSTFLIGQVYDTNFEDETIIATGSACVSTEKVFHFCSSITEISKHYNPTYYAEVKPLGPVVENNGALLTNRLEIVRAIGPNELDMILKNEAKNNMMAMCSM